MITMNVDLRAYPLDGTYAQQQAWRLVFDEKNVKGTDAYVISRDYPEEVRVMCQRSLNSNGINVEIPGKDLTLEQHNFIIQKFSELIDLCAKNPKKGGAVTCVLMAGTVSASVFFCRYMWAYLRRL